MTTSEDRRRIRDELTGKQREKRMEERKCGVQWCQHSADRMIYWKGKKAPLQIPICRSCWAKLTGNWRHFEDIGPMCPIFWRDNEGANRWVDRPCPNCVSQEAAMAEAETGQGLKEWIRKLVG